MDWLEILEWYCEAYNNQTAKALFEMKLAGFRIR